VQNRFPLAKVKFATLTLQGSFLAVFSAGNERPPKKSQPPAPLNDTGTSGVHIGLMFGGAKMPLTGPVPEGTTFFCPFCGALYSVTHSQLSKSESNIAKCVLCLQTMDKWDSTNVPTYKLIHRPEDA
jgi:hypothetical protein